MDVAVHVENQDNGQRKIDRYLYDCNRGLSIYELVWHYAIRIFGTSDKRNKSCRIVRLSRLQKRLDDALSDELFYKSTEIYCCPIRISLRTKYEIHKYAESMYDKYENYDERHFLAAHEIAYYAVRKIMTEMAHVPWSGLGSDSDEFKLIASLNTSDFMKKLAKGYGY